MDKIKVSDVRKAIKSATLWLDVVREHGCYLIAYLQIRVPSKWDGPNRETYMEIKAQAHDLRMPNQYDIIRPSDWERAKTPRYSDLYTLDVSPFYGAKAAEVVVPMTRHFSLDGRDCPARAEAIRKLIWDTVTDKNLGYVYPDCELSLIVAALVELGARIDFDHWYFEGKDRGTWLRERGESRSPRQDIAAQ